MKGSVNGIIFGTIAALAIVSFVVYQQTPGEHDQFAQCLTDNKVKMYGASWCTHCQQQKKLFGKSFKYVDYTECALPNNGTNPLCKDAGVTAYPSWMIAGELTTGGMPLEVISEKTGCEF